MQNQGPILSHLVAGTVLALFASSGCGSDSGSDSNGTVGTGGRPGPGSVAGSGGGGPSGGKLSSGGMAGVGGTTQAGTGGGGTGGAGTGAATSGAAGGTGGAIGAGGGATSGAAGGAGKGGDPGPIGPDTGPQPFDTDVPIGWAVVPGNGLQSTTGGGGGEVVTVSSQAELSSAVSGDVARIVRVQGSISGGDINVGSNKTIIGVGTNATLSGFYLNLNAVQNVIIRNLKISGGSDAIAARQTHHLWIDHVDVSRCGDGLIDITRESDMYTVSWSHFSNHHKTMLLNGGSTHLTDRGKLNGTVHHCYFDGSDTRNPRAGFGMIHIFNNYNRANGYGIGFHTESKVVAEKNYFKDMSNSIQQMYSNTSWERGDALAIDNHFDNASGDESTGKGFTVSDFYMYDFALNEAKDVPSVVTPGVALSEKYGEIGLMPIPGQGAIQVTDSTLSWKKGTAAPTSYVVYFGTANNPPRASATTETSFNAGPLTAGTQYYWRVDQVTATATIPGKLWTFKAQ